MFVEQRSADAIAIVGVSAALRRAVGAAEMAAACDQPVLLAGEAGTGKGVFARFIHRRSSRGAGPFVAVDCASLPEMLLASNIFGHERGAYTGADRARPGHLESARGGTLLLKDVGELPLPVQDKLLRTLESQEFRRLGGSLVRRTDVRIMASTRRDLGAAVRAGLFRRELQLRLAACAIALPPLRERCEDIALLAYYFLAQLHPHAVRIAPASLAAAEDYAWPGNARELRNLVERAVILGPGPVVTLDVPHPARSDAGVGGTTGDLAAQLRDFKTRVIRQALAQTEGNRTRAARLLGVDPASLFRMGQRLGLWAKNPRS